jgi:chromosome segregation ATPase
VTEPSKDEDRSPGPHPAHPGDDLEVRARLDARERHLEDLHEELARARLEADEQRAARDAAQERARALELRASILDKRVRYYQREERSRGAVSGRGERLLKRMERALGRRDAEKARLKQRLSAKDEEIARLRARERSLSARRDDALERMTRRVRELERELDRDDGD